LAGGDQPAIVDLGFPFLAAGKVAEQWQTWMIFHPLRQLST
jgi:hypothetical protein